MADHSGVLDWLVGELAYIDRKYGDRAHDDRMMAEEGVGIGSFWNDEVNRYFHRAAILGLHTPRGRQAAAKGMATAFELVSSMVRVYGELPPPGVPSGEIVDG